MILYFCINETLDAQRRRKGKSVIDQETIDSLLEKEREVIAKAVADGRKDPFNPTNEADQRPSLIISDLSGGFYRRFILEYGGVKFDDLNSTQVRAEDFDKRHCDTEIIPWLEADGKILYPIFTIEAAGTQEDTQSGHHRSYSSNKLWPERLIPRFKVGRDLYPCDENGVIDTMGEVVTDSTAQRLSELKSRIQANPQNMHKQYNMRDAATNIREAIELDGTLEGLIPDGHALENNDSDREIWDTICAKWLPTRFLGKTNRTRLFNIFLKMTNDKVMDVTEADVTAILRKYGLDEGASDDRRRKSRKPFLKHYDEASNTLIFNINSNGRNLEHKIEALFREAYWRGEFDDYSAGLTIEGVCEIDKPSTSIGELNKERNGTTSRFNNINRRFKQGGIKIGGEYVRVSRIFYPKQLKHNVNDQGLEVKLSEPTDVRTGKTGRTLEEGDVNPKSKNRKQTFPVTKEASA